MTDTRQARIEEAARAIHAEAERVRQKHGQFTMPFPAFDEMSADDQDQLRSYVEIVLEVFAADAVGRERVSPEAEAVIEETIRALEKIYAGQITMNNHSHRPWLLKRIEALRGLIDDPKTPVISEEML